MSEGDTSGPTYVDVPTDLQVALAEHASAMDTWRALTPEERRAHVAGLESAANPTARARCVSGLVHDLELHFPRQSRR